VYSKGGRRILSATVQQAVGKGFSVSVQQGCERDSLYVYSKGRRGILSVSVQQVWEGDSPCKCTARVGEGFSL
jgi:hypothetical protein